MSVHMDLETEVAQALAWHLDRRPDPACRCTATARGTDRLGCDVHADAAPAAGERRGM